MNRTRAAAALLACAVLVAAGCSHPFEPGSTFPHFTLVDVNPYTATSGQSLTENALVGPAALVYFGWAT